jgi:hypothetical protein
LPKNEVPEQVAKFYMMDMNKIQRKAKKNALATLRSQRISLKAQQISPPSTARDLKQLGIE